MKLRWLTGATQSLRLLHVRIAADNPQAARRIAKSVRLATKRLAVFPHSGRPGKVAGTRELVLPQWSHIVAYRVVRDEVQILRLFHQSTDWWQKPLDRRDDARNTPQ